MKTFTPEELGFLSAWAKEDREQDCWSLPAHQLQAVHKVPAISFIRLIQGVGEGRGKTRSGDLHDWQRQGADLAVGR